MTWFEYTVEHIYDSNINLHCCNLILKGMRTACFQIDYPCRENVYKNIKQASNESGMLADVVCTVVCTWSLASVRFD